MNSLCNKVIKNDSVVFSGRKKLKVCIDIIDEVQEEILEGPSEEQLRIEEEIKSKLEQAQVQCDEIINSAQQESERIIEESNSKSLEIEKKAYEQGYNQGVQNGYEDGYKEAYEENIEKAKLESQSIINNANSILFEAKEHVTDYMKQNKENILKISISIAEQVLRNKFKDTSSMEELLLNVINEYELRENFVIKVNALYKESMDKQISELKESYRINGDVFVIADEAIDEGNAVIDTVNGRLVVGIDAVLDKIKEELL